MSSSGIQYLQIMKFAIGIVLAITLILLPEITDAQCVMCRAVAEDSAAQGGLGRGLNSGILYLMGIPYFLLAILYFGFFRKKAQAKA